VAACCFAITGEVRIFTWYYLVLIPMTLWNWRAESISSADDLTEHEEHLKIQSFKTTDHQKISKSTNSIVIEAEGRSLK